MGVISWTVGGTGTVGVTAGQALWVLLAGQCGCY